MRRTTFALLASSFAGPYLIATSPLVTGCNLEQLLDPDAGSEDAGSADTGTTTTASGAQGANCVTFGADTTLCQYISLCPTTTLSTQLFPHCGYRIHGDDLDLECWCVDAVCPVGVATSCSQIPGLIGDQDEDTVCAKEDLGGCTSLTVTADGGSTGGNTSCNPACTDGCGNTPECYQACGC